MTQNSENHKHCSYDIFPLTERQIEDIKKTMCVDLFSTDGMTDEEIAEAYRKMSDETIKMAEAAVARYKDIISKSAEHRQEQSAESTDKSPEQHA